MDYRHFANKIFEKTGSQNCYDKLIKISKDDPTKNKINETRQFYNFLEKNIELKKNIKTECKPHNKKKINKYNKKI